MMPNAARQRSPDDYHLDATDYPLLMNKARKKILQNIRDADQAGCLNEHFGPHEIWLDNLDAEEDVDISDITCAGMVWNATSRIADYLRQIFTGLIYPAATRPLDLESGEIEHGSLGAPNYSFDLGGYQRYFHDSASADAPKLGSLVAFKFMYNHGVQMDVLVIDIPDELAAKDVLEPHREVQAEILCEKFASLMWIFEQRVQIMLLTQMTGRAWSPPLWFRKVLSDMALADAIMVGHPYYWHPVASRRLSKAKKLFKKMYVNITQQEKVVKGDDVVDESESDPLVHLDEEKLTKSDVVKYKSNGKTCVKAMEYFPHTRTRIVMGNFPSEKAFSRTVNEVLADLFQNWVQFDGNINSKKDFTPLKESVNDILQ